MQAHSISRRFIYVLAGFACACSSDSNEAPKPSAAAATALRGVVKGTAGEPLAGVSVRAGSNSATSDAQGRYDLRAPAGKAVLRFALAGHVDGFRSVTVLSKLPTQLNMVLLPLAAASPLDASAGGMVSGQRGAKVKVPADAFVDAAGKPVSGMVDVYLTPIDPSIEAERNTAPEFVAQSEGKQVQLESLGLVDISVRQGEQELAVASGKELELSIPVPEGSTPEPSIELWSFDETKGLWVQEGTASYDAETRTYVGLAKHMSIWNADKVYLATCVCGLVKDADGARLPGARIEASGVSYFGSSATNSGSDGTFCLAVRKDSEIELAAYHASTGGQSRRIESGSKDTSVPPLASDTRCVDVGTWQVKRDVFVDSTGESTRCGDVENPFAQGCAADLGAALSGCYRPEGECTLTTGAAGVTTRYANGAYSESGIGGGSYYSATGKLCLTSTFDLASTDTVTVHYKLPDGREFSMTVGTESTGDYVIMCPNGTETRVTPAQQQALQACTASGNDMDTAQQCKVEGSSLDAGLGIPTSCMKNADCSGGNTCCVIPGESLKVCFTDAICKLIQQK